MKTIKHLLLLFVPLAIVVVGCEKEMENPKVEETTTTTVVKKNNIDSTIYFRATIDGSKKDLFSDTLYTSWSGDSTRSIPGGREYAPFAIVLKETGDLRESGGIGFIYDASVMNLDSISYRNIASVKAFPFGKLSIDKSSKGTDGARVFYIDSNKTLWASDLGTADQMGSTFIVTEYKDTNTFGKTNRKKIKATFSCKLYDGKGNSKVVTNGSFSAGIMGY